ncbi:MAG TPA: hypothetical protein VMY69_01520, partial [Phycisphaerae bacterium]|nr:hypothetical protein [Phycisphaerae bacterium]
KSKSDLERNKLIEMIFGENIRADKALRPLLESFPELLALIDKVEGATGDQLLKDGEEGAKRTSVQLKIIGEQFRQIGADVGELFGPTIKILADAIHALAEMQRSGETIFGEGKAEAFGLEQEGWNKALEMGVKVERVLPSRKKSPEQASLEQRRLLGQATYGDSSAFLTDKEKVDQKKNVSWLSEKERSKLNFGYQPGGVIAGLTGGAPAAGGPFTATGAFQATGPSTLTGPSRSTGPNYASGPVVITGTVVVRGAGGDQE